MMGSFLALRISFYNVATLGLFVEISICSIVSKPTTTDMQSNLRAVSLFACTLCRSIKALWELEWNQPIKPVVPFSFQTVSWPWVKLVLRSSCQFLKHGTTGHFLPAACSVWKELGHEIGLIQNSQAVFQSCDVAVLALCLSDAIIGLILPHTSVAFFTPSIHYARKTARLNQMPDFVTIPGSRKFLQNWILCHKLQ